MAQNPNINTNILESGIPSMILTNPTRFSSMCELPNNKFIATSDNNIYEFDLINESISLYDNSKRLGGHSENITCCCLLGNNKFLITGSSDKTIRGWNIKTGNCEYILNGHDNSITCLVLYKKGQIISSSMDGTIKIWDVASKQCLKTLNVESYIFSLCVTENYIIAGNYEKRIILWNNKTYNEVTRFITTGNIASIIQLNESHIICASEDKLITIWNIDTYDLIQELEGHTGIVRTLVLLNDGRLASGSIDGTIRIWNLDTYECENILQNNPKTSIKNINMLSDGRIVSIHEKIIRFWNPKEFPLPSGPTFNENGESLDKDGSILPNCAICWDIINPNKDIKRLDCGGIFHIMCIKDMKYCPICNQLVV